jgi:hypothetical protein
MLVILWLIKSQVLFAQVTDTSGSSSLLYRGTEYTKIISPQVGTPFLYSDKPSSARLWYYGAMYDSVEIQYDIENDVVVTRDFTGQIRVQLVSEKLSSFILGTHVFTRVAGTSGFYELLYSGKWQVFVKWQKVLSRKGVEEARYETYKQVFVQDSKGLTPVSNRNDLMEIFGKDKKRAMEYAKSENLNFKKDLPGAVARMVSYADKNGFHD